MTSENNGMYMPVAPAYGYGMNGGGFGNGFGADGWWIILLFLLCGNGMWGGFGGMGGFGNMMLGYDFPWLMNGQQGINANTNAGFNQAATAAALGDIQGAISTGFGNVQTALCSGFAGVNAGMANGFAQAEISDNARQMANMQQMFGIQSALQNCCCENRAATADLKYTVATENCADRTQSIQNTRDIIDSQTRGTQAILDKLCQLELDGVKGELSAANNTISQLRTQLLVANNDASQTSQTARILAGQAAEVDALYNRLNNCPVPTVPVYGRQPVFTCGGNGCGCNGGFAA